MSTNNIINFKTESQCSRNFVKEIYLLFEFLIKLQNCLNKNMNVKTLNIKIDEFVSYTMSF